MKKVFQFAILNFVAYALLAALDISFNWDFSKMSLGGYWAICSRAALLGALLTGIVLLLGRFSIWFSCVLIPLSILVSLVARFLFVTFHMDLRGDWVLIVQGSSKEEFRTFLSAFFGVEGFDGADFLSPNFRPRAPRVINGKPYKKDVTSL